jgi:hypothetical protein
MANGKRREKIFAISRLQDFRRLANGHRQKIVDVSKRRYQ